MSQDSGSSGSVTFTLDAREVVSASRATYREARHLILPNR